MIGLGLIALAVFFGFLVYVRTDGGQAGSWTLDSLRWLLGAVHYGVPAALLAGGAILVLRPVLPAVRPFRAGAVCLFAALCLALAAGTLGLGPDGSRPGLWDETWVRSHGGMVGRGACTGAPRRCSAAWAPTPAPCSCSSPASSCSRARPWPA